MQSKCTRLGFVADNPLAFDGQHYRYLAGEWRYIERVALLFDEVDICAKVVNLSDVSEKTRSRYVYILDIPNGIVHNLNGKPKERKWLRGWLGKQLIAYRIIRQLAVSWDFAFFWMPAWPTFLGWIQHRWHNWHYAVWARADWSSAAKHRWPDGWLARLFLPLYLRILREAEYRIVRDAVIRIADGLAVAKRYPDLGNSILSVADTTLSLDQFRKREDTCTQGIKKIIYVGSLVRRKGVDISIRAIAQLLRRGFDLEFHIVGDGPERIHLTQMCAELEVEKQVKFHGYIPNGPQLLDRLYDSDLLILTSYSEGFPRVIHEAMSQSLPVVATRVGGIPFTLKDNETALLVETGDSTAVARAIEKIIEDGNLRQDLILNGYNFTFNLIESDPLEQVVALFKEQLK